MTDRSRGADAPKAALVLAGLVAIVLAGCSPQSEPAPTPIALSNLAPIPHPDLEAAAEPARRQLSEQRTRLEDALDAALAGTPSSRVAAEMGRMAELYLAYGLLAPAAAAFRNASGLEPERFRWRYGSALVAIRAGSLDAAVEELELALTLESPPLQRGVAALRLGEALLSLDRPSEAQRAYEAAGEVTDGGARGSGGAELEAAIESGLGRVALRENRPRDAIQHFERALELVPGAGVLHHRLATAYRLAGDDDRASREMAQVATGDVSFPDPIAEEIEELATTAGAIARRGGRELVSDRPDEAVAAYRAAVAADPSNVEARRSLSLALLEAGDPAGARTELERALQQDPDSAWLHHDLGSARQAAGDAAGAVVSYSRALEITPDFPVALFGRANALLAQQRWSEALSDLERLLELDPHHSRARYQRAMSLSRLGNPERAIALLRDLLDEEPGHREARQGLADLLLQRGELAAAAEEYRRATLLDPQNRQAWIRQSLALAQLGAHAESRATLESALRALPGDDALSAVLARILATAPDPAVRDGRRAVEIARGLYESRSTLDHAETLTMALAESGDFDQAIRLTEALIAQVREQGQSGHLPRLEAALDRFRRGQPVRMQ